MAAVCLAIAVIGFTPTYWLPLLRGTVQLPGILHLHALFFYSWVVLFLWQAHLASAGRIAAHRELGMAGIALASGMCLVGMAAAINSIHRADSAGMGLEVRRFSIISFSAIFLFACLVGAAIFFVRKPEVHKRLLLVATATALQAAIGRWFALALAPSGSLAEGGMLRPPPVFVSVVPSIFSDLLVVAAMIYDRRRRGSVHPAYWAAIAFVLVVQFGRIPLSTTDAWADCVDWILQFAP